MGKGKRIRTKRALSNQSASSIRATPAQDKLRARIPRPNVTTFTNISVVPVFAQDHPLGGADLPPGGSGGSYQVDAVLGIPGISPSVFADMDWDRISDAGDSLIEAPAGATRLTQEWHLGGPDGQRLIAYEFEINSFGRLATGSTHVLAEGFRDALAAASDVLESYLSTLSFHYDLPAEVVAWRVTEEETSAMHFAMKMLGKPKLLDPNMELLSSPGVRELLSTWREALNASTPMSQALGFYKIIERIHKYRGEREARTRNTGKHYLFPGEKVPTTTEGLAVDYERASSVFIPYLGKKFTRVWNEDLRERVRNAVAHLREDAPSLTADRSADIETCRETVPVLHYIARVMLKAEMADQNSWPEFDA
jgi:hypothetical protein